jgi:CBS domain containing-hemolysin-like protein
LDPDSSTPIIVLVVLLLLYALFAAAKESIISIRRSRRLHLLEEDHYAAELINRLAEDSTRLLTTEQLLLKLTGFSIVAFSAYTYTSPLAQALTITEFLAVILITVVAALVTLLFGELIPKEIARNNAEPIAFWAAYPFNFISHLAAPLAQFVTFVGRFLTGHWDEEIPYSINSITEEDLRTYVDASEEEGVLREEEKEMIYSIFDLGDTLAREVMVPRIDMVALEANTPVMEALDVILGAGHSRVPIYVDYIDNVVGILYAKDLLTHWREGGKVQSVSDLARDVFFVPETKSVSDLLRELQARKVHIAIVVDEYGGTAGLVTIEDILEEIVGEIQDEYDPEEFIMQRVSADEYIFNARMDLDDINDIMSTNLPTEDADTLGGLVYNLLGRVPLVGDGVEIEDLHLTVLDVEGRRIGRVRAQRLKDKSSGLKSQDRPVSIDQKSSRLMNNTSQNPISGAP